MIRFDNVSKTFPDGTRAVADFSLEIPSRSITVLLGSSGCGKTTLLRMVNRLVEPTSGRVFIDEDEVSKLEAVALRRRIGYVMQSGGLLPHRTVLDNIATVPVLNGTPRAQARSRAGQLMELVGLGSELAGRYPSQLSGGQRQRVGVARALAADPNILLMDEPFGAVDPLVRTELQQELLRLQRDLAKTILFVTHDTDEALELGDQVLVLKAGAQIVQAGTPEALVTTPASSFVEDFLGGGRRQLHQETRAGHKVAVDAGGRLVGRLEQT